MSAHNKEFPNKESPHRVFLVVVDASEEMRAALRYASLRARKTGGIVALFGVVEPRPLMHWMGIESISQNEMRTQLEGVIQNLAVSIKRWSGKVPVIFIREGERRECLLRLIEQEPSLSVLVLAAAPDSYGPGPLVSAMTGRLIGGLRIPVTIVPGNLSNEEINNIV